MSKYKVAWISMSGFANEGNYIYGTAEEVNSAVHVAQEFMNARAAFLSDHKFMRTARAKAESESKRAHKQSPDHEICIIGTMTTEEFLEIKNA